MPEVTSTPDAAAWFRAAAFALTGTELDAGGLQDAEPAAFAVRLTELGWTPERLAAHRVACRDGGTPWPHPVPASLAGPGTAARLHALVVELRRLTGTSGLVPRQRPEHVVPSADDRRLLAEVPPHHGSV